MAAHGYSFPQSRPKTFYFCKLNLFTGEVKATGLYREQERTGLEFNELQKSTYFSGGILIKTNSSILHPNFLNLDLDAGYTPEKQAETYLTIPDQSEVRTMKKLNMNATFFKEKDINLSLFGNYDESFSTRENLTNIKSTNSHLGSSAGFHNRILPFQLDFHTRKWIEKEIVTGRKFTLDQKLFGLRVNKSFTQRDRSELNFSHDNNISVNQNELRIANTIDMIDFSNHLQLDSRQKYNLTSTVSELRQTGNQKLSRFMVNENLSMELPLRLSSFNNLSFYKIGQTNSHQDQFTINSSLQHKLFNSLVSRVNFTLNNIRHSVFSESNIKTGIEFNYIKKIPRGQLNINYRYDRYRLKYASDPSLITITNEQYSLTDGKITLLRRQGIDPASIIVKDITSTLIFLQGVDFTIIDRNNYTEIRRIPGGAIPNGGIILVDYTANQAGDYKYDANMHTLNTDVLLFNNRLSLYYRFGRQGYTNLEKTELLTLNYFTQHIAGLRVDFDFINAGLEYESNNSTILPYNLSRYYLNVQKNLGNRLMLTVNGNLLNYTMLDETENRNQQFIDITAKCIYTLVKQTYLNLDIMYRKQTGHRIDLDLLISKAEINSTIRKMTLVAGMEIYKRNYVGEEINFKGAYLKIIRKF
jgi:hypothetical protein